MCCPYRMYYIKLHIKSKVHDITILHHLEGLKPIPTKSVIPTGFGLHVKTKMHNIAILHDVLFTLNSHFTSLFTSLL